MKLTARIRLRPLVAAAILLASVAASADPIWQWPSLQRERLQKGRFFGLAAPSQPQVLAALHAAALAERTGQMERMQRNVRANPLDLESRHRLAVATQRQGRYQDAIAQYRQVLVFDRTHGCRVDLAALYEQWGRLDEAAHALSEMAAYHPNDLASRKRLAGFLEKLGKPKDAVRVRRELVAIAPRDHTLHAGLAKSLLKAGQPAEACKAIAEAIRLRPTEPSLKFEQAKCLRLAGDVAEAEGILKDLAGKYPATAAPEYLGYLLLEQGKCSEALQVFEKALKTGAEKPGLVMGAVVAGQGTANADAIRYCHRLRRLGAEQVANFLLASYWLGNNDRTGLEAATANLPDASEGMAAAFLDLLTSTKGDRDKQRAVAVQVSLARAFLHAKWTQAATRAGEKALALAPESVLVSVLLAECYGAAGQKEKQLARLTDLSRQLPRNDLLTYHLAAAQANAGLPDQARTRCIRLLDRSPGHHNARR
ncbi:tetratricopeptide repeat protein, partial [bacterium]|nr:tetratricopeptide repeat protein [bacterium]